MKIIYIYIYSIDVSWWDQRTSILKIKQTTTTLIPMNLYFQDGDETYSLYDL